MLLVVVILLYQRFGAIFMSMHRYLIEFFLRNQVFMSTFHVGKLNLYKSGKNKGFSI